MEKRSEALPVEMEKPLKQECTSNWSCEEWSGCIYTYSLSSILGKSIFLNGENSRSCKDLNKCTINKLETEACKPENQVEIVQIEKCSKNYIEIYDVETNKLVSRLELQPDWLNIDIILEDIAYCDFCDNNKLDMDKGEDNIDCDNEGEVCPVCQETIAVSTLKIKYIFAAIAFIFIALILATYFIFLKKTKKRKIKIKKIKIKKAKGKFEKIKLIK